MRTAAVALVLTFWSWVLGVGSTGNRGVKFPAGTGCGIAENSLAIHDVQTLIQTMTAKGTEEISTNHAVLIAPTEPLTTAGGFAAEVYASLPRDLVGGHFTTVFSKFVVVGHSRKQGPPGISLGDDVCGDDGFTDEMATQFLNTQVPRQLGSHAPKVVECRQASGPCSERLAPGLERQLPFLGALLGPGRSLKGNLMPVMMQGQSLLLAARTGDALSLLVHTGGIWEAERVLFVFAGDLSKGLPAAQEGVCDEKAAEVIMKRGVPQVAEYFGALLGGAVKEGCPGPLAVPRGFGPILAATRVASRLKLQRRRALVAHTGLPSGESHFSELGKPVRGFIAAIFWEDTRSVWERLGAQHSLAAGSSHQRRGKARGLGSAADPNATSAPQQGQRHTLAAPPKPQQWLLHRPRKLRAAG